MTNEGCGHFKILQFLMSEMKTVSPLIASPNFAMVDKFENNWRERERGRGREINLIQDPPFTKPQK